MDYADFELTIGKATDGGYLLRIRTPAGELEQDIPLHLPPEVVALARGFRRDDNGRSATNETSDVTDATDGSTREIVRRRAVPVTDLVAIARELGERLFSTLLVSEIDSKYRESFGQTGDAAGGLRVQLRIEPPELAVFPWEFLFDPRQKEFLGLSVTTPITRYLRVSRAPKPLRIELPVRILGMIASPSDFRPLQVQTERTRIEAALKTRIDAGAMQLEWVQGQTWDDLQSALGAGRGPWHVFHFIGHGGFDDASGEGLVALCASDGTAHRVPAAEVADLLGSHPSLRLVVLNSCEGARGSRTDSFSSTGAAIIRRGVPAVVSMQFEISDAAALEFSRMFYDCLSSELSIEAAVTEARKAIDGHWESETVEWGTPVLHLRSSNGRLFRFDTATTIYGKAGPAPLSNDMPRFSAEMPTARRPSSHVDGGARRGLEILRQKVRSSWIEGVLERDLHQTALLDLELDAVRGMVESVVDPDEDGGNGTAAAPLGGSVRDVFVAHGGSLLILGEPGSGKTTAALSLARDLLDRADKDDTLAIPVVFNLSSWAAERRPLELWMAEELASKYSVPVKVGRAWLAVDRLSPFLDGLDEMPLDARAACVEAINRFQTDANVAALVVSCRYKEYADLPNRLTLNAAIRLRRLTIDQVRKVVNGNPELGALARALRRDSGLFIEARTPLMLNLMIQAYRRLSIQELERAGADTPEARRNHVFAKYVENRLRRWETGRP